MKKLLLFFIVIFAVTNAAAQKAVWQRVTENQIIGARLERDSQVSTYFLYSLDLTELKQKIQSAPSRDNIGQVSNVVVIFPNAQGEMKRFAIYEASVMHPELAARYPDMKSYVGMGIDDKTATIRFSITRFGLHTMTFSGVDGTSYIDPYTADHNNYMVYNRSAVTTNKFRPCGVSDSSNDIDIAIDDQPLQRSSNSLFKTYRLAMACTIEYAAFHVNAAGVGGGTLAQKKAAVLAAMVVTMTRVNGVYERDLALTMQLVANNDAVIFITSDNFDNNNNANILLDQSQTEIDAIIGSANYDIGHTVSTGGGGVAQLQSPCSASKARGITGLGSPVGDPYDIDYVAHEMGHQWGGNHTFNSDQGGCNGNRSTTSSYEPGSGTTIMAYAGLCSPHNVQNNSDAYFHARSLLQMQSFINTPQGNCGVVVANGNTPPTVSAGTNYTIPFGTAFVLHGTATDVDAASLTYCWEQYNAQVSVQPPVNTSITGPNFRSLNPSDSPDRYFPRFSSVLANNLIPTWEVVPSVARSMVFSLVVRDNQSPLGGQTERATMTLTYANAGPFKVTSQNAIQAWAFGSAQTVTWDVAGTDANGINTATVNIKMSTDGGLTFPITLAANTPNDGSEVITAPSSPLSQTCRILIEAVGNVYYAVNTTPFYLGYTIVTSCNTYSITTPFAIPDNSTSYTVRTINIPTAGLISDVNFTIDATHPNLQNLQMAVIRPGGTLQTYFNQQCSGNANMNVTFDAQGAAFTCASPTTGTYAPPTGLNLGNLNGFSQQGNWQFGFRDIVAGNSGTINSITLEVCSQTLSVADFEFENFALYPNPNTGKFTVQFDSKSGNKINIAVHDIQGRKIFDKVYANNGLLFSQTLQLENTQAGIYLVSIADGAKKTVKRIVIQ